MKPVGLPVMLGSRDSRCAAFRRLAMLLLGSTSAQAAYSSRGFRWDRNAAGAANTAAITQSAAAPGSFHVPLSSAGFMPLRLCTTVLGDGLRVHDVEG